MNRCLLQKCLVVNYSPLHSVRCMSITKNHYDILGVKRSATLDEIKAAYLVKTKQLHPDVNPDPKNHEKFVQLQESYNILIDEKKNIQQNKEFGQKMRHSRQQQKQRSYSQKDIPEEELRKRWNPDESDPNKHRKGAEHVYQRFKQMQHEDEHQSHKAKTFNKTRKSAAQKEIEEEMRKHDNIMKKEEKKMFGTLAYIVSAGIAVFAAVCYFGHRSNLELMEQNKKTAKNNIAAIEQKWREEKRRSEKKPQNKMNS